MVNNVDKQIAVIDGTMTKEQAAQPDYAPVYQIYENSRVPVSKATGKLWKQRFNECTSLMKQSGDKERWDEVISYYQNDQGGKRNKTGGMDVLGTGSPEESQYTSENIVFANVSALVPATYAKNPDIEITSRKPDQEAVGKMYEALLDTLIQRKNSPGINLKPKMRKAVVTTTLTNVSYLVLSYVRKEESSEQVVKEIESLSEQLSKATDLEAIREIEGKLLALEERVMLLTPSGPRVSFRLPDQVLVPKSFNGDDICESEFIMIGEYVRTDYIRAMYGKKDENGDWMSVYKPTHVIAGDKANKGEDDNASFMLLTEGAEHTKYGFKSEEEFKNSCHTYCWWVWDRVTRRVYLFNANDWTWPIWVWNDPYNLSRFYPVFDLRYYTDPVLSNGKSEVMYYLDQQDEINRINNERARMRHWAMSKVFVNTNVVKTADEIDRFLQSDSRTIVHGLDIPEGKSIKDVLGSFPLPSTQFEGLFDTRPLFESVNRISSVTPVMQNTQFRTNTTNKAIESYESSTQTRLDEKIDAIEEVLGDLGRALLEMCVQFMTSEEVIELIGQDIVDKAGGWQQTTDVSSFNREFSFTIVGGSTLKPTGKVKKDQAMQLGQILGQFANASPMLVIVLLKMLERAFGDDVVITPQEWETIVNATTQQMQRGSAQQGAPQDPQQAQAEAQQGQPPEQAGGVDAVMTQVEQMINSLPPEAKQYLGAGIAKGVPLKQLVMQLTQAAQSNQQRPQ